MPHDPGHNTPDPARPTPDDRKRVEHMLKCSLDARTIVADDDADAIAPDTPAHDDRVF